MKSAFKHLITVTLLAFFSTAYGEEEPGPLHVASPVWQDQIIYFLMIDRFNDGNPENNDQGVGVYKAGSRSQYNGGDLQGVKDKLDYIQALGATAVWTTPQVANQWWDPIAQYWGYHGYWARDFKAVDEHYGTLQDYQALARALHRRGMYLVQDVVVNHTGNFFYYDGPYDPVQPEKNVKFNAGSLPTAKPTQFPLNLNNVTDPQQKALSIFNWTPQIYDTGHRIQETQYQLSGLDDMNTRNPLVREFLKDSFGYWIQQAGVDAFRVDTAKYVEENFYEDFIYSSNGIKATAKQTGRNDFLIFGEFFEMSLPMEDRAEQKISRYLGDDNSPRVDSPIGFPLYQEIQNLFITGRPTSHMTYRLGAAMRLYKNPYTAVNFIDNHDVERFVVNGTLDGFKQAYALMMTIPGIPAIYQGDEQLHRLQRQAMFAGGYGSSESQFDENADMYQYIRELAYMRLSNKVLTRGRLEVIQDNQFGPGIFAYRRDYEGESAYIILNTADETALLTNLETGYLNNDEFSVLFRHNYEGDLKLSPEGRITTQLPARSVIVLKGKSVSVSGGNSGSKSISIDPVQALYSNVNQVVITGRSSAINTRLLAIQDGNFAGAVPIQTDVNGQWQVSIPANGLGSDHHSLQVYWPETNLVSGEVHFEVSSNIVDVQAEKSDPEGDDKGPNGNYQHPGYQQGECYMDLLGAKAEAGGNNLLLTLKMCDISTVWAPANGFDHLALNIHMDLPDRQGSQWLPKLSSTMIEGKDWDINHSAFGWGNLVFTAENVSQEREGELLTYSPDISVDKDKKLIHIRYEGSRLGVKSWKGSTLYITTWDKDEGWHYRQINSEPSRWHFASKSAVSSQELPKIADSMVLNLE
ncbi:alpha-amylase [Alteromonas aestuariivivens]|uniref:Alpha-amylase n=1 Tax=Alteromonas aestuariivivens TaxID=1938339 RepID=A0A3D8M4H7_9ALTE|nr:alpha-amylase family glycosyl hydrolase [Alteromonas aestuariivivens]RDV24518.1 alpha-amylase [Alteromonas aestuariivivens]